jgi:outer membrane protein
MKKVQWIINGVVVAGLIALGGYHLLKKDKTVYVDIGRLMQEYQGMKDARAEFEKKSAQWQANADTLVAEWQKDLKSYEKERAGMSKKEKELKEELLRNKQQQINQYHDAIQMKSKDEEQKLSQTAINRINEYVEAYGKQKGYMYVLGANGSGNIVYADKSRDITDIILKGLQEEYEKEHKK